MSDFPLKNNTPPSLTKNVLEHTPTFSNQDASRLAISFYGLNVTAQAMTSERDQNFLIRARSGEKYVLKIANAVEDREFLIAQQQAMSAIGRSLSFCPQVVPAISGDTLAEISSPSGSSHLIRLVTFLDGTPMANINDRSPELLFDLGGKVAMVDRVLADFDHPAMHQGFHWDLANAARTIDDYQGLIEDVELKKLVHGLAIEFRREVEPLLSNLRRSVIHNDANSDNVLVGQGEDAVVGLIDFGDMVHSYTIGDLAVAIAYAVLNKSDPLAVAAEIVKGYHSEYSIEENEIGVLWWLVRMRLCMSVCIAANQRRQRPENEYLNVSQDGISKTLPMLAQISSDTAERAFREACGLAVMAVMPSKADTLMNRRKRLGGNLRLSYKNPLKIVRGSMQYLYDDTGRQYLDAYNNVPHVGHCNLNVVHAAHAQMTTLNTNTRYLHDLINQYAEELCAKFPSRLSVCYFVNSGSEANELALRLARAHTGSRDLIVLEGAYHGNTTTMIDISPYKHNGPGGSGPRSWVHLASLADGFRGPFKYDDPLAAEKYAQSVESIVENLSSDGRRLAGFIAESLPSVGGQIVFPDGYLSKVYSAVRDAGGVCIADEVQTAYGRIGTHFWGFESYGIVPDIVVLGKPIGNGHPIGAVITTREIADSFDNGMEFFSTFGGNTVSCAIGLEVLRLVQEENLQSHAKKVGSQLLSGLQELKSRYPIIGDVRGSGFFIGVELVKDRETLEPATEEAATITNALRDRGILIGTEGQFDNVLKIRPPMPFSRSDANQLLEELDSILRVDFPN